MHAPDASSKTTVEWRRFSRKLVRQLGFLRPSLAGSDLDPSAVHAVIEIGHAPGIQARDLAATLRLDKSNASRQVARLASRGLVRREAAFEKKVASEFGKFAETLPAPDKAIWLFLQNGRSLGSIAIDGSLDLDPLGWIGGMPGKS